MRSVVNCRKAFFLLGVLCLSAVIVNPLQALVLNFSATLTPGTCTFSLDKSTLVLGSLSLSQLQPATLLVTRPFTLIVQDCSGTDASLTPVVNVSGDGITRDSKWLFRSGDSSASGVGVMLVNKSTPPSYSDTEIKNGDGIPLAGVGVDPLNQNLTFYAGVTCGGSSGCASAQLGAGTLTARVLFNLAYR
ncbi:fimbrial protein [Edaphovirga cremea]|uniref:fimbrial protein n=1 Tax=Edaphovirga cremea TaxID=2267246 RepID=UPI000DEFDC9D|nr:fimbrial protein [Edaphovirga cremea]